MAWIDGGSGSPRRSDRRRSRDPRRRDRTRIPAHAGGERLRCRSRPRPARRRDATAAAARAHHRAGRLRQDPRAHRTGAAPARRSWQLPPSALSLVAFNKRAQEEMQERTRRPARAAGAHAERDRARDRQRLATVRARSQARGARSTSSTSAASSATWCQFPRRAQHRPVAPWIEALSVIRLGLRRPRRCRGARTTATSTGSPTMWPQYRAALERARRRRLRRAGLPRDRAAAHAIPTVARSRPAGVPRAAGRRVPGPHPCAPAARPAAAGARRRGVRCRRRRPDDLRLQRRRSGVADRLRDCSPGPAPIRSRSTTAARAASSRSRDRLLRHNRRRVAKVIRAAADRRRRMVASTDASTRWPAPSTVAGGARGGRRAERHRRAHPGQRAARAGAGRARIGRDPGRGGVGTRVRRPHRGARGAGLAAARDVVGRVARPRRPRARRCAGRRGSLHPRRRLGRRAAFVRRPASPGRPGQQRTRRRARRSSFVDDIARLQTAGVAGGATDLAASLTLDDEIGLGGRSPRSTPIAAA